MLNDLKAIATIAYYKCQLEVCKEHKPFNFLLAIELSKMGLNSYEYGMVMKYINEKDLY